MNQKTIITILVLAVIALGAYAILNQPDKRSFGDKVSDAAGELQDKTPAERLKDDIKDATGAKHD